MKLRSSLVKKTQLGTPLRRQAGKGRPDRKGDVTSRLMPAVLGRPTLEHDMVALVSHVIEGE